MMTNNVKITMIKTGYKKEGTKWIETKREEKQIDEEIYNNVVGAKKFMKNLGGTETHKKSYTSQGNIVTYINSISPSKLEKSVYEFKFN